MADLVQTPANVQKGAGAKMKTGTAGAAVTAGQPVYEDGSDGGKLKPASNASEAASKVVGIALNDSADEQPLTYQYDGGVDIGAALNVGTVYILSAAGAISPAADAVATDWMTVLGIATAADNLGLKIHAGGVQLA